MAFPAFVLSKMKLTSVMCFTLDGYFRFAGSKHLINDPNVITNGSSPLAFVENNLMGSPSSYRIKKFEL